MDFDQQRMIESTAQALREVFRSDDAASDSGHPEPAEGALVAPPQAQPQTLAEANAWIEQFDYP